MAKLIYTLPWTMAELKKFCEGIVSLMTEGFLNYFKRTKQTPFVLVADEEYKVKRFFHTEEEAEAYYEARTNKAMTDEIENYNFTKATVPGEEQYKMTFNLITVDGASTYGTTAKLRFTFSTADTLNSNLPTQETISIYFTFSSDLGTKTETKRFAYSTEVTEFDITEYLEAGENTITMVVTGLTSGLSQTVKATYTYVYLPFSSSFDISAERTVGNNFGIPYTISGIGTKTIEMVMDGGTYYTDTVYDGTATKTYQFVNNLTAGFHYLQMKAYTTINNVKYESNLLYFEFVVNGDGLELTTALIQAEFNSGTAYFLNSQPGLLGEQYIDYTLDWAYFSTTNLLANVIWKTKLNGVETVVGSRSIDEIEGKVGVKPEAVTFQPDTVGTYDLYATYTDEDSGKTYTIGQYTINVSENTAGLREPSGYTMKLTSKGRSNGEPSDTLKDWSNNGYKTTFNNKMTMDGMAGWITTKRYPDDDDSTETITALRFDNGATGQINCKPFATENNILNNGGSVLFYFKTRNVEDETVPLIEIGDYDAPSSAYLAIYGKKVYFRASDQVVMEYEFASEEETWLAIVVHPKTGVTDAKMRFFIFNGIEAPGTSYSDTAVFDIGKKSATSDTNGMINIGNADGKAAIDMYAVYVYPSLLSMWQGMNLYMINHGGDVASMMKKNNIFTNNNFDTPNINTIKDKFRTLEIIGNLGLLQTQTTKVSFYGSCIYNDPFEPKYNFYRTDGNAYIETAGQSRITDLMAKSFHLDLNKNDTVATYQDGKLCHKNRFIFADGNIPENGVRIDLCGADSSICRNAAHMKLVNKVYPNVLIQDESSEYQGYVLRTPAQQYALSGDWSKDMASTWGGTEAEYPWSFNINLAPDSVPIVVLWHEKEDDPIQVYGLACMTEEKKASYANGNHSIYLKEPLSDGTLDPYDRYSGKNGKRGWDNTGVMEMEFVNPTDLCYMTDASNFNDATVRSNSFELAFPKEKDLTSEELEATWQLFYTEVIKPISDTYGNQEAFDNIISNIIYMPSAAMYYNKVMDRKLCDSLCRNLHLLRLNFGTTASPKWRWYLKWWDADVSVGLYQSNAMGVDPHTNRDSIVNGQYVMSGRHFDSLGVAHSSWFWDGMENNADFKDWCLKMAKASYTATWTAAADKAMQDSITDEFSEGLYNLDGLQKFLYAYRQGNDYMIRMQGRSTPYRHGVIDDSYAYEESIKGVGDYAAKAFTFSANGISEGQKIYLTPIVEWIFGFGTTTTTLQTGVKGSPDDGEIALTVPNGIAIARDFVSVYGAEKMSMLDVSTFCKLMYRQIGCDYLTQVLKLYIGYPTHEKLANGGFSEETSITFTGVASMTRLVELSLMGLHGLTYFDFSSLNHLTTLYLSGTGLQVFAPADGTKFNTLELPETLTTINAENVQLGDVTFWQADLTAKTLTQMTIAPTSLLTLDLTGMGSDEGTHNLVHMWCQMLAKEDSNSLYENAQITYRRIEWGSSKTDESGEYIKTPMSKEDLLTLAKITSTHRTLTGYVFCDEAFNTEERNTLSTAFGSNVFNINATSTTLVCDCPGSGVSVSASGDTVTAVSETEISAEQGNNIQFTGAGFPLTDHTYLWRAYVDDAWSEGSEVQPEIIVATGVTLNRNTGLLTTTENSNANATYRIGCYDSSNKGNSGEMLLALNQRSYPNKAVISLTDSPSVSVIDDEIQITSIGSYLFGADNKRIVSNVEQTYTGRMTLTDGGVWTLAGTTPSGVETSSDDVQFKLILSSKPEGEYKLTLKYKSKWRNGTTLSANTLKLAIVGIIEQLLLNADAPDGNKVLYAAMLAKVGEPATANYFTSQEVKKAIGSFVVKELATDTYTQMTNLMSGSYFVPQYMKNVDEFDFSDCSSLAGDVDISSLTWIQKFDLSGTASRNVNGISGLSSLTSLKMHAPTIISISNCPNLNISE